MRLPCLARIINWYKGKIKRLTCDGFCIKHYRVIYGGKKIIIIAIIVSRCCGVSWKKDVQSRRDKKDENEQQNIIIIIIIRHYFRPVKRDAWSYVVYTYIYIFMYL